MRWIKDYHLFLFDFDGLLVNTEEIHFMAYKQMCAGRGFALNWDFPFYCTIAHYSSDGLEKQIYARFPELQAHEPRWAVLYAEKKQAFLQLVREGAVQLMPGIAQLLTTLKKENKKRCVVTHSAQELVEMICQQNPILKTIPNWITREDYSQPKPDSECYLKAIEKLAHPSDRIIGFEDTPRGLSALLGTRAESVLISQLQYPEIPQFIEKGTLHYPSFEALLQVERLKDAQV